MTPITPAMIAKITEALRDFGYPDLTDAEVAQAAENVRGNRDATVIDAFVRDILTEAGLLEGRGTP